MRRLYIKNTHGFSVNELRSMEKKTKDTNSAKRLGAVWMVMEGYQAIEIAKILNITRQTVSKYAKLFEKGGLKLLFYRRTPPGRESYLSEEEQKKLRETIITNTPREIGIGMESYWDTRIIQHWLWEQFGISMSREGIRGMLHRMGFSYTRSTYSLAKADPQKQEQFEQDMDQIKKTS